MAVDSRNHVDIRTQVGVEATPGTFVSANRIIEALDDFNFNMKRPTNKKRTRGRKFYTHQTRGKEWGEGTLGGDLCFNGFIYLCAGLLPYSAPVAQGSSGGHKWTFIPNLTGKDNPKTFTGEIGDADAGDRYPFLQQTSLGVDIGQDEAKMQSSFFAQKPTKNVAMTVGATRILARAVERSMVNVYLTSNFANLGQPAALLDDADSERFSIGEKFKPRWVHKRSTGRGFASRSEVSPEVTAEIVSEYNAQARGWSTNIDAGDLMYLRYDIQGELIGLDGATEVYEQILIDVAGKFEEPQDEGDQEGSWAYRYPFCSLDDPNSALGAPFKITVINKLATL